MEPSLNDPSRQLFDYEKSRIQRSLADLKKREANLKQLVSEGNTDREWVHYQLLDIEQKLGLVEVHFAILSERCEG